MDTVQLRPTDENDDLDTAGQRKPYLSPILYIYGRIEDISEGTEVSNFDGFLGNSFGP